MSASASFDLGLIEHSKISGLLYDKVLKLKYMPYKKKNYAREDARGECTSGFDDAAIAHGLFDAEGREHARHYDPDEGVGHPSAGADTPPEAESVIHGRVNTRVYVGSDKAPRLECEGVGEESVVVQDSPGKKSAVKLARWTTQMDRERESSRTMRFRE